MKKINIHKLKSILLIGGIMALVIALAVLYLVSQLNALSGPAQEVSKWEQAKTTAEVPSVVTPEEQQAAEESEKKEEEKKKEEAARSTGSESAAAPSSPSASTQPSAPAPQPPKKKSLYNERSGKVGYPSAIADQPTAVWLGGWTQNITQSVNATTSAAAAQGALPVFVIYNIPNRDCGSHSAGGSGSSDGYRSWVQAVANGIGNREAMVIVEPDALAQIECLSGGAQQQRYADLSFAVNVLATQTRASVYLDAGNSTWINADVMADRLRKANVAQARGFSLNVANFETSSSSQNYGNRIAGSTGKYYVIDTSRNGRGANGEWCNPRGRGLGTRPTIVTQGYLDANLWIKTPGESDGQCNGGPSAGTWWPEYADELIRNAVY